MVTLKIQDAKSVKDFLNNSVFYSDLRSWSVTQMQTLSRNIVRMQEMFSPLSDIWYMINKAVDFLAKVIDNRINGNVFIKKYFS